MIVLKLYVNCRSIFKLSLISLLKTKKIEVFAWKLCHIENIPQDIRRTPRVMSSKNEKYSKFSFTFIADIGGISTVNKIGKKEHGYL